LLVDHYHRLIMAAGKTFESMLHGAYKSKADYLEFVRKLNRAEKEVNQAALQTVGRNDTARDFVDRMEKAVEVIRQSDADKYFPEGTGE